MRKRDEAKRPVGLLIAIVLMALAVWVVGERWRERQAHRAHEAHIEDALPINHGSVMDRIKAESAMYDPPVMAMPVGMSDASDIVVRDLATTYARRAYSGAPPQIPHPVDADIAQTMNCNVCHEKGGFVPKYNAYTPITPHPEYSNCMQCHVPKVGDDLFVETEWESVATPTLHRPMLPGGPPPIPHTLQLRENCLACHAGPAAPLEIRTTHPERINCRQCHVPSEPGKLFEQNILAQTKEKVNEP